MKFSSVTNDSFRCVFSSYSVLFVNIAFECKEFACCFWKKLRVKVCLSHSKISTRPGPYFIKVKIILSLKFKINLIFYLIKEFMKHSCLNFFYEIVNIISIKVKRN